MSVIGFRLKAVQSFLVGLWCLTGVAAMADVPEQVLREFGILRFSSSNERETAAIQTDLAWIGLYQDRIDGRLNQSTRAAINTFQESLGRPMRRTLDPADRDILSDRARQTRAAAEFRDTRFEWTGARLQVPTSFVRLPEITGKELTHVMLPGRSAAGLSLRLQRYDMDGPIRPQLWLNAVVDAETEGDENEDAEILLKGVSGDFVYLSLRDGDFIYNSIFEINRAKVRGVTFSYRENAQYTVQPLVAEMLQSLDLFASDAVPESQIRARLREGDYPGGRNVPDWYRDMVGSGSGSIVSREGHILTNHHVVAGCARITVNGQDAILFGSDIRSDLALLLAPAFAGRAPVKFRSDTAVLGEQIYVMGYPVFTTTQSINVTDGIVSSTVGLKGDRTHIQITAPVQPGNSGGPVLDRYGSQIAVVVQKVSTSAQISKNIENIAWVIRGREALEFMRRFGVNPIVTERSTGALPLIEERVAQWRQQTVRIECHGNF